MRVHVLCLLLLLAAPAAATTPRIRIEPAAPILGKPLTIVIPLAADDVALTGLPDLGPFEPLAPPIRGERDIRLVVLPMRPGERELPPFPLQVGNSRQIETDPLKVTVLEGVAADARPAPYKGRPLPLIGTDRRGLFTALGLLLAGALLLGRLWRLYRDRLEHLPPALQLERLQSRLEPLPPTAGRDELLATILLFRFGPITLTQDELRTLRQSVLRLIREGR